MANIKISELEEYTQAKDNDLLVIVDTTNNETKKIKNSNLSKNKLDKTSIKNIKTNSDENIYSCNYVNTAIGSLDDLKTIDKSSVVNSINEIDNRFTYSTNEQIIGKWINNKPIYRKVLNIGTITQARNYINHNISNLGILTDVRGRFSVEDGSQTPIPSTYTNWEVWVYDINSTQFTLLFSDNQTSQKPSNVQIIMEYTKTTD